MEKSKIRNQAIPNSLGDHGRDNIRDGAITMSADSREAGQVGREDGYTFEERCLDARGTSNGIRTGGWDTMFVRLQRRASFGIVPFLLILIASLWIVPVSAVFVEFQNCLSEAAQNNLPLELQFIPLFVDATFNTTDPNHQLVVTVWGNVTGSTVGSAPRLVLPDANNTEYWNGNSTLNGGKIVDSPFPDAAEPKLTTLSNKVNILTYEPWNQDLDFCNSLLNASCPLGPKFFVNASNPYSFPAFQLKNNFFSTYAFTSFSATLLIKYGDASATPIGCTSTVLTPDLGGTLSSVITYIPAVILIMVAIATAFAAIYSPWGSSDTFRWTTNYGRDADLLRLVTPGFGDCLQYIQFVVLTGGLTLSYPGFYQPIVSKASWSILTFNESFVRNTTSYDPLKDGLYITHGTFGLDRLRQLIGLNAVDDVWTGMTIWLLVILAAVLVLIQLGFFIRWAYRHLNKTPEEDLRAKNMPFSMGNVIRIVFNYFLLPIVALSMFQLVVASRSPSYTVALAVVMLVLIIGFAIWLLYVIASTRPKSYLFDDLPTVLLYGSLYNTYSDNAAPFALIPIILTFVRGVAIGAVQPSGIAQLVLLAICEVITLLTLHAFRPFHSPTSMNAIHTVFSAVRFTTILLMVSFAPSLGVTEGPKGWIGYAVLLMHALVLIFGFFLNAMQTIIEVVARMAGAGDNESGAARGGLVKVFGMRQLSKRLPRRDAASRQSHLSSAAMLDTENDRKSYVLNDGRNRSQSAGSTVLLNRQSTGLQYDGIEPFGAIPPQQVGGSGTSSFGAATPREASTFSFLPSAAGQSGRRPVLGLATAEAADPYYRPPRLRRPTLEAYSPGAKSRGSWASGDWANKNFSSPEAETPEQAEEGPSISGRNTPTAPGPAAVDGSPNDPRRSQADYTTREVDFYYGVRGPALNANIPSRRIKTGPADPTGIPASAAGWFKGLFGGKTKEKGKGFEVVRSSRMPPGMQARNAPGAESPPEGIPVATGGVRNGPIESDDDEPVQAGPSTASPSRTAANVQAGGPLVEPLRSDEESEEEESDDEFEMTRISDIPPNLSGLEIPGGGIELPSRFPSKATSKASSRRAKMSDTPLVPDMPSRMLSNKPNVPRKSSRRKSQNLDLAQPDDDFLHQHLAQQSLHGGGGSPSLPFDRSNSNKRHSDISTKSSITGPADFGHSRNTSSALGRLSADIRDDRPTSMGYVHQHSIRTVNPSDNPQYLSSSAEVVDGRVSGASSMENQRQ